MYTVALEPSVNSALPQECLVIHYLLGMSVLTPLRCSYDYLIQLLVLEAQNRQPEQDLEVHDSAKFGKVM